MEKIICIYSAKQPRSFEHILLRQVDWYLSHPRNIKFWFKPNWTIRFWFWNVQLLIFGVEKCNGRLTFRLLNWQLEIGW